MAKPVQIERGSSVEVCVLLLLLLLYNAIVNKQSYAKPAESEEREGGECGVGNATSKGTGTEPF